eukprot:9912379-Prorocentrum_lima.AAC.1
MTSSLVGSEMCIRDRRQVPGLAVIRITSGQVKHTTCRHTTPLCGACHIACLLYTSDAADDM